MTQEQPERKRARRAAADEGEPYTRAVMREVKRLRLAKDPSWSAERLAEEMAKVGVPWTRDTVTNLESGRRKRIAAHEVLALAWVLDVLSPIELLAPDTEIKVQVTPEKRVPAEIVRLWFRGEIGSLRDYEETIAPGRRLSVTVADAVLELRHRGYGDEEIRAWVNEAINSGKGAANGGL